MRLRLGAYELSKRGAARYDWRDPYYLAVGLSWPWFLVCVVATLIAINALFSVLYLVQPDAVANARAGAFADHFFFSVETLATVGYGDMHPVTLYGHVISTIEIMVGMGFTALATGLAFVRFSRPRAKIRYAEQAVVTRHFGQSVLMIRIANERITPLTDACARLNALIVGASPEGQFFRTIHPLPLFRDRLPIFALTWSLIHVLDEASPLHGFDPDSIRDGDVRLFLTIEARDPLLCASVHETYSYSPPDIVFGMRYADAVMADEEGRPLADLARVSLLEPDPAPAPDAAVSTAAANGEAGLCPGGVLPGRA